MSEENKESNKTSLPFFKKDAEELMITIPYKRYNQLMELQEKLESSIESMYKGEVTDYELKVSLQRIFLRFMRREARGPVSVNVVNDRFGKKIQISEQ